MEQFTSELRLGDVIDDHCIKCRRVTNHAIVSLVDGKAAKVRCRTCYHDHDYRNEQAPPTKKELLQQALLKEGLVPEHTGGAALVDNLDAIGDDPDAIAAALAEEGPEDDEVPEPEEIEEASEPVAEAAPVVAPAKKKPVKGRTKRA
ncbi:MAG: hypothetical protein M3Z32_10650 [Acidobacteriota bacterium]|nr:hypothetical protein [Acidobacteriota bacterium]